MKIFNLGAIDEDFTEEVGGKARGLDRLIRDGFKVAPGFVLIDTDTKKDLETAAAYFLKSGLEKVAVRSSATAEDGVDFSFAGQFETFLNVKGADSFKESVQNCIDSLYKGHGKEYSDKFGKSSGIKMSVIVQEMIDADFAGVCFTQDPNNVDNILVEAVEGLGEALVSGLKAATQYSIPRKILEKNDLKDFEHICEKNKLLEPNILREICVGAIKMQEDFDMPIDSEWAVQDGVLYWLQARPITVLEYAEEDEFDPKFDLTKHMITRCNISEMLPGAITPLTWSISLFAIDHGLREMLRVAGAIKKIDDIPPYSCAFSVSGHLFMNLSTLYRLTNAAFLAKKGDVDFSICGRRLDEDCLIPGKKQWFGRRFINTFKYLRFIFSRNKARKRLVKIAKTFVIAQNADALELYNAIDKAKDVANRAALLHYITSAHSGAMSSALIKTLQKKVSDIEECKVILAKLLECIDGIESVDILASLQRIAKAILEERQQAKEFGTQELVDYLEDAGEQVQKACEEFFNRHGHRAIREAELRNKSWSDDKDAFIKYLKTVLSSGKIETEQKQLSDFRQIFKELGFRRSKIRMLVYFTRQAREGVKNREFSKSQLIKVLDRFKKAYTELAQKLVQDGKLPDEDAVFFLTHQEIGTLVKEANSTLVKKALQRRRLLKYQSELKFNEIYTDKPEPLTMPTIAEVGNVLQGTAISRGIVTGPARIVRNFEEASQLQKGEIMVAVFTDIGWSPFYCLIDGLVTEIGSALSHGAVVAREYAVPLVSNIMGATTLIKTGDIITVNGSNGSVVLVGHQKM